MARNAHRQAEHFEDLCRKSIVLPLTDEIIVRAASIYGDLHQSGQLIGDADILIAATALAHQLALVTGNVDHFTRISGLRVESWRKPNA